MERIIRLNWEAIVKEARQRRKSQGLSQRRLAAIAEISPPTVSRFEQYKKDIQLSSALAILNALGMTETFKLRFLEDKHGYNGERGVVSFTAMDGTNLVRCMISEEALGDHFSAVGSRGSSYLKAYINYRDRIQALAEWKYVNGQLETDGSVLIRTTDISSLLR